MSEASILIAEDEALAAMDLAETVKELGHGVADIVSSGSAAVARAAQLKRDLVLMDIQLEGEKDGIMAAAVIINELHIPVDLPDRAHRPENGRAGKGHQTFRLSG